METSQDLRNILLADEPTRTKTITFSDNVKKLVIFSDVGCILKFARNDPTDWYSVSFTSISKGLNVICLCKAREMCEAWEHFPYELVMTIESTYDLNLEISTSNELLEKLFFMIEPTSYNVNTMGLYVHEYVNTPLRLEFLLLKSMSMSNYSQQKLRDIFRGRITRNHAEHFGLSRIQEFILDMDYYEKVYLKVTKGDSVCHFLLNGIGHHFSARTDDYWLDQPKQTMRRFFGLIRYFPGLEKILENIQNDKVLKPDNEELMNRTLFYIDSNL